MTTALSIIEDSYGEIRVKKAGIDLTEDEIDTAIRKLNRLMVEWDSIGIHLGFRKVSDSGEDTGIPDWAENATITTLAMRLASTFGKAVADELNLAQRISFKSMQNRSTEPVSVNYPDILPVGSGNDRWADDQSVFFVDTTRDDLQSESNGSLKTEEGITLDTEIEPDAEE